MPASWLRRLLSRLLSGLLSEWGMCLLLGRGPPVAARRQDSAGDRPRSAALAADPVDGPRRGSAGDGSWSQTQRPEHPGDHRDDAEEDERREQAQAERE